jgi:cell division protein FtsB
LVVVPAAVVVVLAATVAWGEKGVVRLVELRVELREANAQLRAIERKNQRLIRDIHALEQDRTAVERVVAEELGWATPQTTLYRFAESGAP